MQIYSLTPEQWSKATIDLAGRHCMQRLTQQGSLVRVRKVIIGNVKVQIEYADGIQFKTDSLKFHILRSGGDLRTTGNAILGVITN